MSVFGIASSVATFAKVKHLSDKEVIDTCDFRLHYRVTAAFLFLCCILCTATSLFGDPISCLINTANQNDLKQITTYCWITTTFTVPRLKGGTAGVDVAAHNVGQETPYDKLDRHNYYQWVPFVLFFQGLLFYAPHWLWKKWEGNFIHTISEGLRGPQMETQEETKSKIDRLCTYFIASYKTHKTYALSYSFCVLLNFINTIANIFLINRFLGGVFLQYGTKVLSLTNREFRSDPMEDIFPKITKCIFRKYGPGGGIVKIDAMCVLALNVMNEKIYIFLWFWLIILAAISGLGLLYTLAMMKFPEVRSVIFSTAFKISSPEARTLVRLLPAGDFLLLHFLGQNMRSASFSQLLKQLCDSLSYDVTPKPDWFDLPRLYPDLSTLPKPVS